MVTGGAAPERSLSAVLKEHRSRLITCWGDRITGAIAAAMLPRAELLDHIPAFVDELIRALHPEAISLPPMSENAEEHGEQRLGLGFDVAEVVREYGMLHECILQIAAEAELVISPREHQVIVKWLNMGIADAVAQYVKQRDLELQRSKLGASGVHRARAPQPAGLGQAGFRASPPVGAGAEPHRRDGGARPESHGRVDRRRLEPCVLETGVIPRLAPLALRNFLHEIENDAAIEAQAKSIEIVVLAARRSDRRGGPPAAAVRHLQPRSQCREVQSGAIEGGGERRAVGRAV